MDDVMDSTLMHINKGKTEEDKKTGGRHQRGLNLLKHYHFRTVNIMGKRVCRHCPIPEGHTNFLVRLANHLVQVHELSDLERKYWLQFAKLQNTKMVRVYDKDTLPKTISL